MLWKTAGLYSEMVVVGLMAEEEVVEMAEVLLLLLLEESLPHVMMMHSLTGADEPKVKMKEMVAHL